MCANPDQTMIAQWQIQTHKREVQDSMSEVLAQIKKRSEDDSLASIAIQIKAMLSSLAI